MPWAWARYHAYLRQIYERIQMDSPNTNPEMTLSISNKTCKNTPGINGVSPTLFLFCIIPRPPINTKELPIQREGESHKSGQRGDDECNIFGYT